MHNPQITVLMPAYNAAGYIHQAISSVLAQTFSDFELLIINDGSTDDTLTIINSFNDARIRVISQTNGGVADALNMGLKHARADYIARFDADDICYADRLAVQYDFITEHPEYAIVGSGVDYVDVQGNYVFTHTPAACSYAQIKQLSYKVCPFIHSGVFYRKHIVTDAGGYNEHAYTFEDHFLWANILKHQQACNLPQALIKVRLNPESVTIDEKWRTPAFRRIKYNALSKLELTADDGLRLNQIGKKQHSARIKHGAYYALLGKKYLWNNYQPAKARQNLLKTLSISPLHVKNYLLLVLSYLPQSVLYGLYHSVKSGYQLRRPELPTVHINNKSLNYGS